MKKILLIAAACAALAACNISDIDKKETPGTDGTSFVKGQRVILTVGTGSDTKAAGTLNTSTGNIEFKWKTGDQILVTVGESSSATFTLKSGDGEATATFEGEMPAGGSSFSVQYPVTAPDLTTTQTYSSTLAIPHDMMLATASNCTVYAPFTLTPQYAVLRLNLYGGAREVSQIVVTGSSSSTYTLSISSAVTVGKDKESATPFFIVLPATESFVSAAVTANAIEATANNTKSYESYGLGYPISASTTFTATEAKSLTAGSILNMKAVSLTTVWAPVNCGYDADHTYGLLYQFGRTDGCTYDAAWTKPSSHAAETQTQTAINATWIDGYNKSPKSNEFYKNSKIPFDWYTNDASKQLSEWPMTAPEGTSGIGNPCPEGWRVPTYNELNALLGGNSSPTIIAVGGQNGCYFNGTSSASSGLFLPAAGVRICNGSGSAYYRGSKGYYWTSSVNDSFECTLYFGGGSAIMGTGGRANGFSVRCVQK